MLNFRRKNIQQIIESLPDTKKLQLSINHENLLIHSENLLALKILLYDLDFKQKIDLIYIDPPFATNNTFTVTEGRTATISRTNQGKLAYSDTLKGAQFLEFLWDRLILLRELLSDHGSIYLHIDYKIGHYVKIIMDEIFGQQNFRNDITRIKTNPKNFKRLGYGNIKDLILFYTKTNKAIWNEPKEPYSAEDIKRLFPKTDVNGRRYTTVPLHAPGETKNGKSAQEFKGLKPPAGRHWRTDVKTMEEWDRQGLIEWSSKGNPRKKIYADEQEGKRVQDVWEYKDPQYPVYPTEKNLDMLKLIVNTSSNPDSYVLDAFCGSGTSLVAANLLQRKWIGIDKSELAIKTTEKRLSDLQQSLFTPRPEYQLISITDSSFQLA